MMAAAEAEKTPVVVAVATVSLFQELCLNLEMAALIEVTTEAERERGLGRDREIEALAREGILAVMLEMNREDTTAEDRQAMIGK